MPRRSLPSQAPFTILSTAEEVEAACVKLAEHAYVTVDTEFLRETTYWPKLCLIQVASRDAVYLIDPLAPAMDLAAFFALMRNPQVVKVFHAARQDIEIFWHLAHCIPAPLFDTQVAAMVLGYGEQVSYETLVNKVAKTTIDKSQRYTDWSERPLSQAQLIYAAADVTHLRVIYDQLLARLEEEDRTNWLKQEMAVLSDPETYETPPDKAWQKLSLRVKNPREFAILQVVAAWRELQAQAKDMPRRRVMKDETIFDIIKAQPKTAEQLAAIRSVPQGFVRSESGQRLVEFLTEVASCPESDLPPLPQPKALPHGGQATVELLKVLLRKVADDGGVASKVIATVEDLEHFVAEHTRKLPMLSGWRYDMFGRYAEALKEGRLALSVQKNQTVILDISAENTNAQSTTQASSNTNSA